MFGCAKTIVLNPNQTMIGGKFSIDWREIQY